MTVRTKVILAALWALSLLVTARFTASAQAPQMGQEVRFLRSQGTGAGHQGVLVANFGGQWLPVTLDKMPDGNSIDGPTRVR
jgi:hypothetical protein